MRKTYNILFSILSIILLASCKGNDGPVPDLTDHGSVRLEPESVVIKYGETIILTPKFSDTGEAKNKTYSWRIEDNDVIEHKILTGNIAQITAKRIGETKVTIYSTDGTISGSSKIEIDSRTNILNGVFFEAGSSMSDVRPQTRGIFNAEQSDDRMLVYDLTDNSKIKQEIYYFQNNRLYSTIVILNDTDEIRKEAEEFIEERYRDMNISTAEGIKYYDTSVFKSNYASDVVVGIFLPEGRLMPENISGNFGVKFTTQSNLQN